MRAVLQNGRVIYMDNKGRESRVFMYHIVNNWDNLSRHGAQARTTFQSALVQWTQDLTLKRVLQVHMVLPRPYKRVCSRES